MIRAGYLADVRGVRVGLERSTSTRSRSPAGTSTPTRSAPRSSRHPRPRTCSPPTARTPAGRKALVFVADRRARARDGQRVPRRPGSRAEALDGTTPREQRRAILERLRTRRDAGARQRRGAHRGRRRAVGRLRSSWRPRPARRSNTPNASGAGCAPFPGKDDCLVIDVVGVTDRLDLQTLPRLFNLTHARAGGDGHRGAGARGDRPRGAGAPARRARERPTSRPQGRKERDRWGAAQPAGEHARAGAARAQAAVASPPTVLAGVARQARARSRSSPDGERWRVLRLHRDGHEQLAGGVDLGYAHGIAEDFVRAAGATGARRSARQLARAADERRPGRPAAAARGHAARGGEQG